MECGLFILSNKKWIHGVRTQLFQTYSIDLFVWFSFYICKVQKITACMLWRILSRPAVDQSVREQRTFYAYIKYSRALKKIKTITKHKLLQNSIKFFEVFRCVSRGRPKRYNISIRVSPGPGHMETRVYYLYLVVCLHSMTCSYTFEYICYSTNFPYKKPNRVIFFKSQIHVTCLWNTNVFFFYSYT